MSDEVLQAVIRAYGLPVRRILSMQSGYRNKNYPIELTDGTVLNVIFFKREPDALLTIKNARTVGDYLWQCSFPARHSYDHRILRVTNGHLPQYAGVYAYLPGETIPWEAYTMKHLKSLGAAMSDMHAHLSRISTHELPSAAAGLENLHKRIVLYVCDPYVRSALAQKLSVDIEEHWFGTFSKIVTSVGHLPRQQALHLDFVRSNILFEPNTARITGVLDFEKTAVGNTVVDIARTLAFLLVDCKYKTESDIRKYFLRSGYNGRGSATYEPVFVRRGSDRIDILDGLVCFFLFHDFYKFLRHNPYESLRDNEHFLRTRDILEQRGIISVGHISPRNARGAKLLQR